MKSEPDEFSIDDLARAPRKTGAWFGVRNYPALAKMQLLQRGNRLSITPVDPAEWEFIMDILQGRM